MAHRINNNVFNVYNIGVTKIKLERQQETSI